MKNKQLLNEIEITKIVGWPSAFEYAKIIEIVTAQDRKTTAARDKWWIQQLDSLFGDCIISKHGTECYRCGDLDYCDNHKWQSLKQSLEKGIENGK